MRIFKTACVLILAMQWGCSPEHYVQGHGDAGHFIIERALLYGGHPLSTNSLPEIKGDWRYLQDEFGVGIQFSKENYAVVDTFLKSAFGPPASNVGWSVRDIGVTIYLVQGETNAEMSIHPLLSEAQQARMFQKMAYTVEKNTR